MSRSKRFLILLLSTLVVLFASVFLFSVKASAESIPLPVAEEIIEQKSEVVDNKEEYLTDTTEDILELQAKKETLSNELESIKSDVENLKKQVAEKKAAAERERKRVEQLRNMFVHVNRYAGDSAGNLYAPGNCTWYAKSRRPDLPNSLGNANTWYSRAAYLGWNVGLTPKKGAIGATSAGRLGHVVYVEGVTPDGQYVTISEMNYQGLYSMNTRTVHYTEFRYIYELD